MPQLKGSTLDGPTDAVADRALGRGVAGRAANDEAFLKSMGIEPNLKETPEIRDVAPPVEEGKAPQNRALDRFDQATTVGWNAQLGIPAAAGIGGWFAKRGQSWGPVAGAPFRAIGTVLGAPQKALSLEIQDVAHVGSGRIFRAAKRHMAAAESLHAKATGNLDKAERALQGDNLAVVREALADAKSVHSDVREAVPVGVTSGQALSREGKARGFSAGKAKALNAGATNEAFEAAVTRAQVRGGLSTSETQAIEKAREHMKLYVENTTKAQEQVAAATPLRAKAIGVAKQEVEKKRTFLASAERKLESTSERMENTVSGSKPLNWMRGKVVAFYERSATRHGANAAKSHAKAMQRLDNAIAALPEGAKFSEVKTILENTKAKYGTLPATTDRAALEKVGTAFSQNEKLFEKEMAKLYKSGNLTKTEKVALGNVEKSFSGRFFGFGGVAKKFNAAHGPLEAQGAAEASAKFAGNLKEGVKGIPKALSEVSGRQIFDKGLYWGSQAVTAARSAQVSGTGFSEFKQISADLQGVPHKQVSSVKTALQLMHLAPVDEAAKEARGQFWKSVGPRLIGNAAGMVAFSKLMARGATGKTQAVGMLVQIGATGAGELIGSRNQLLDAYKQVSEGQKHGMFDKGAYLGLIVHAHKADKLDMSDKRIVAVAEQYSQEKTSAANVLREISSGKFDQRLAAVPKEAPAAVTTAAPAGQPQVEAEQATTVARDRLNGTGAATQPVVGTHTMKENVRRTAQGAVSPEQQAAAVLS